MKQHDIKAERAINGNNFYIMPFGAFTSANLSGEIIALLTPVLAAAAPLFGGDAIKGNDISLLDIDAEAAAPILSNAAAGLSGDKLEALLKKLLVRYKNITVAVDGESEAQWLTEDLANELFCGETQDLFILAIEVIKVNYAGFFKKLGGQSGKLINALMAKV